MAAAATALLSSPRFAPQRGSPRSLLPAAETMFLIDAAAAWPVDSSRDQELLLAEPVAGPWLLPLVVACEAPPPGLCSLPAVPVSPDDRAAALVAVDEASAAAGLDPITGVGAAAGAGEPAPAGSLPPPFLADGGASPWRTRGLGADGSITPREVDASAEAAADPAANDLVSDWQPWDGGSASGLWLKGVPLLETTNTGPDFRAYTLEGGEPDCCDPTDGYGGDNGCTLPDAGAVAVAFNPTVGAVPRLITDPVPDDHPQPIEFLDGEAWVDSGVVPIELTPTGGVDPLLITDPVPGGDLQTVEISDVRVQFVAADPGWAAYLYSIGTDGQVASVLVLASYDEPRIAQLVKEHSDSGDWLISDAGGSWLIANFPVDLAPPVPERGVFAYGSDNSSDPFVDDAYSDEAYSGEAYSGETYSDEVYIDEGYADEAYVEKAHLDEAHADETYLGESYLGESGVSVCPVVSPADDPTYGAYLAFLQENPQWREQNGADGIQLQVITASTYLPWIELETPGAAQAFDRWYEQVVLTQKDSTEESEAGPTDLVVCSFLATEDGEPLQPIALQDELIPIRFAARGEAPIPQGTSFEAVPWINVRTLQAAEIALDSPQPVITTLSVAGSLSPSADPVPTAPPLAADPVVPAAVVPVRAPRPALGLVLAAEPAEASPLPSPLASPDDRSAATAALALAASRPAAAPGLAELSSSSSASDGRLASDESHALLEQLDLILQRSWVWRSVQLVRGARAATSSR